MLKLPHFIQTIILFVGLSIFAFVIPSVQAFTMSNTFYIIVLGNMNSIAGQAGTGTTKITFTSGELGAGLYTGTNYKLCAGFYGGIYCNKPTVGIFTFTVNPTTIDFGTIDPTSPVTRTNILDVLSVGSGYSVTAQEDHSLRTSTGSAAFIPDTTCDTGVCTPSTASMWVNTLTYGFGYRCDNAIATDCIPDFPSNYYKPFANAEIVQNPQVVMQGNSAATDKQAQITYKVNVAGSQLPGVYGNTITYVASPNF